LDLNDEMQGSILLNFWVLCVVVAPSMEALRFPTCTKCLPVAYFASILGAFFLILIIEG